MNRGNCIVARRTRWYTQEGKALPGIVSWFYIASFREVRFWSTVRTTAVRMDVRSAYAVISSEFFPRKRGIDGVDIWCGEWYGKGGKFIHDEELCRRGRLIAKAETTAGREYLEPIGAVVQRIEYVMIKL